MKKTLKIILDMLKETFKEWKEDKASRLAAALSYYTVFALAPLVLVLLTLLGLFMKNDAAGKLFMEQVSGLVGPQGSEFFQQLIDSTQNVERTLLSNVFAIGAAIFGATGLFVQLKDAINTAWGIQEERFKGLKGLVRVRAISFTAVLALGFLLLVSLFFSTALTALSGYLGRWLGDAAFFVNLLNQVISLGIFTVVFAVMYKYLPDLPLKWHDVWTGAIFTAVLFSLGKFAIGLYLGNSNIGDTYGAFGSVMILLLWVYYSAQILLFGAEFTQVYASRFGSLSKKHTPKQVLEALSQQNALAVSEKIIQEGYVADTSAVVYPPEPTDKRDAFVALVLALIALPSLNLLGKALRFFTRRR